MDQIELVKQEELFFHAYDDQLRYKESYADKKPFLIGCDSSGRQLLKNIKKCKDINEKSK